MDDTGVVAVDLGGVHHLEEPNRLANRVHGQVVVLGQVGGGTAHQLSPGLDLALGVLDIGAARPAHRG